RPGHGDRVAPRAETLEPDGAAHGERPGGATVHLDGVAVGIEIDPRGDGGDLDDRRRGDADDLERRPRGVAFDGARRDAHRARVVSTRRIAPLVGTNGPSPHAVERATARATSAKRVRMDASGFGSPRNE